MFTDTAKMPIFNIYRFNLSWLAIIMWQWSSFCSISYKIPFNLLNVQKAFSIILDSWLDWFISRFIRLEKIIIKWETFHKICISIFCSIWWYCFIKSCSIILYISTNSISKMFLWFPNCYGKYTFINIFFINWYVY